MKAYLRFDLPEERSEHAMAVHGQDFFCALSDIDNVCRAMLKHGETWKMSDIEGIRNIINQTSGFHDVG